MYGSDVTRRRGGMEVGGSEEEGAGSRGGEREGTSSGGEVGVELL
jgi:hypothetical protein